jgi:murein DD-endopeptidase MepM/ murein hydrolase activator NlpD
MYDLRQYLYGEPGHQHELKNTWGDGFERVQTHYIGRRRYLVKNALWEAMYSDGQFECREVDTSPEPGQCYELNDPNRATGSAWVPTFMPLHRTYKRAPKVTFRYSSTGAPVPRKAPYTDVTHIEIVAHHDTWQAPGGISVNDVLEIVVYRDNGGKPGEEIERYWYARGMGLVAWKGSLGRSFITKIYTPGQMPDLVVNHLSWWKPPEPPLPIQITAVEGEMGKAHFGALKTTAGIYLRASRKANGAVNALTLCGNGQPIIYYPATQKHENKIDWMWVEAGQARGWMGRVYDTWDEQFGVTQPHVPGPKLDPPLMLGNPLSVDWVVSDDFDVPRDYKKFPNKKQKHEGKDFIPRIKLKAGEKAYVLAMQTGEVDSVGYDPEGYGHWLCQKIDWYGHTVKIWYAHLEEAPTWKKGHKLTIGATIAEMGDTGFVTGPHVHITIQWIGHGLAGYVVDDVIDFTSMLPGATQPAEDSNTPETPPVVITPSPVPDALYVPLTSDEIRQAQMYHKAIAEQQEQAAQALLIAAQQHRSLAAMYEVARLRQTSPN